MRVPPGAQRRPVVISTAMLLWTGLASLMLARGGFFRGPAMSRGVYIGALAVTWVGVLALLLA
jgi:hypothetical protein